MTYKEVATMINSIGLPNAYYQFPETGTKPPFICFLYTDSDDLYADNTNYVYIRPLSVELYTDNKDFSNEAAVEAVLLANGLPFEKSETYIDTERMFMVTYRVEVLITEESNNG